VINYAERRWKVARAAAEKAKDDMSSLMLINYGCSNTWLSRFRLTLLATYELVLLVELTDFIVSALILRIDGEYI
jgi:hypothetical protein